MELIEFLHKPSLVAFHSELEKADSDCLRGLELDIANGSLEYKKMLAEKLYIGQQRLASYDKTKGMFTRWFTELDFKKDTVYNLLRKRDYLVDNIDKINEADFWALPESVSLELAKNTTPPEVKEAILNNEATTFKEVQELKARLKAEQDEKEKLSRQLNESKQALDFALSAPPKVIEKEVILENPKHLQTIQELQQAKQKAESQLYNLSIEKDRLEKDLKLYKAIDGEYDKKQKEIRDMQIKIKEVEFLTQKSAKELQAITSLDNFVKKTDLFLKDNLLEMSFAELKDNPLLNQTKSEAVKRFQMLIDWIKFCSNKLGVEL